MFSDEDKCKRIAVIAFPHFFDVQLQQPVVVGKDVNSVLDCGDIGHLSADNFRTIRSVYLFPLQL